MENNKNNNSNSNKLEAEQEIRIDANPITSKSLRAALLNVNPHMIVNDCMEEIISGLNLNILDLPFYAAAFEILRTSISTKFDKSDQQVYNKLLETSQIYTFTQTERPDTKGDDTNENETEN